MKFDSHQNFPKIATLKSVELLTPEAFQSFVQTLLDTSTDEDGDKLSDYYEAYMIDETGLEALWNECYEFIKSNAEAIQQLTEAGHKLEDIMYDFCMTRNREGVGFWEDGDYPHEIGLQLTQSAHQYAPASLYVGDDGGLYVWNS